jgi:transposase
MTQNERKQTFIGIDIAKHTFDVCLGERNTKSQYQNDSSGYQTLIKALPLPNHCLIVMEPTGGYEKALINALQAAEYDVILANAFKVRKYAQAMGYLAKNDPIDSLVIKYFGEDAYPKGKRIILEKKSASFKKLEAWLNRSRQLTKSLKIEKQRLEKATDPDIIRLIKKEIRHLENELNNIKKTVSRMSRENHLSDKVETFKQFKGIGDVGATMLVVCLPELGTVSNKKISALVGVAPYCHDSGTYKGQATIRGGREALRSVLYMGMLSAIQHNPVIKAFYERLRSKGKAHKVAMVACLRKTLCILNAMARNNTQWQVNYAA